MSKRDPVEIDGITGEVDTLPPQKGKRYRCKLDSLLDIKQEMSKVYREARSGVVDVQDASRLVYMLGTIGKIVEVNDFEKRISLLEEK